MIKEVSKAPAPKQIGIGAAAGWMSGYVMMKVGKAAATGKQTFKNFGKKLIYFLVIYCNQRYNYFPKNSSNQFDIIFFKTFYSHWRKSHSITNCTLQRIYHSGLEQNGQRFH